MTHSDIFSVELFPNAQAAAVFLPKLSHVFREDSDYVSDTTPDGIEYVRWGANDDMPYKIIDLIESDETLSTCQIWNAEMCYGQGLQYNTDQAPADIKRQVADFLLDNPMPEYFLGCCQDMKFFSFCVSVIYLSRDGHRIVGIQRKEACYCRFAKVDNTGCIPYIVYGNFRNPLTSDSFERIPLLNPHRPWADLQARMGRSPRPDGLTAAGNERVFAVVSRFPGADSLYYPIPHYAALFRGSWFRIKQLIGVAKLAKLSNAAPIKYVVEVSPRYWEDVCSERHIVDKKDKRKLIEQQKKEIMNFITNTENTGAVIFSPKMLAPDGSTEIPAITIRSVESIKKEGGDWESDIAEAINMICFTMHVHSNLVGSVPGSKQSNNSGSDKRELYTIAQALQKPYHDVLFQVHQMIIRYNGWNYVFPECPFIQLTTLDTHKDAKQVSIN